MPSPLDELISGQVPTVEPPEEEVEEQEPISALDDIDQQVPDREWVVGGDISYVDRRGAMQTETWERTYTQEPLSAMAMMEFTGLIGQRISEVMSGPDGLTIEGIMSSLGDLGAVRQSFVDGDFNGIDAIVHGLSRLASYAPGMIEDCQCIWLRVPIVERPIVKEIWSRSPSKGGLSMDDWEEMLDTFIAQNYDEVERFFVERLPRQYRVWRARRKMSKSSGGGPRSSRRSRSTRPTTQSP